MFRFAKDEKFSTQLFTKIIQIFHFTGEKIPRWKTFFCLKLFSIHLFRLKKRKTPAKKSEADKEGTLAGRKNSPLAHIPWKTVYLAMKILSIKVIFVLYYYIVCKLSLPNFLSSFTRVVIYCGKIWLEVVSNISSRKWNFFFAAFVFA